MEFRGLKWRNLNQKSLPNGPAERVSKGIQPGKGFSMFLGNCPTRLDEKGRLKIPADFKHEIDKNYDGRFYLTSFDGAVIKLYPMQEWELVVQKVKAGKGSYQEKERFKKITSRYGQRLEMDAQGRVTIADWIRDEFGLKGDLDLLGMEEYIQIEKRDEIAAYVKSNPLTGEELDSLFDSGN